MIPQLKAQRAKGQRTGEQRTKESLKANLKASCREESRVLIWSLRNIQNFVYNACLYEFEDIIGDIDDADVVAPPSYNLLSRIVNKTIVSKTQRYKPLSLMSVNPYGQSIDLWYEYDIYFVVLDFPWYVASINLLKNWRRRCRFAVCYIIEVWNTDIQKLSNFMAFFDEFDLICVGTYHVLDAVKSLANCPCMFLAPGVDTLKFYPDLEADARSIDVCSLGRRSSVTHDALLAIAEKESFFYYHELTSGSVLRINDHQAHRTLVANLLKNSRYFITNHAKVNLPELIADDHEIGYRFFEGAAAGAVLIGDAPKGEHFERHFDWSDAVIPIKYDEHNIADILKELDAQPGYLKRVRAKNTINSLRKHDWVYRWEQVLEKLGLPSNQALNARKNRLQSLATTLESNILPGAKRESESSYSPNCQPGHLPSYQPSLPSCQPSHLPSPQPAVLAPSAALGATR